jgi:Uri superfamily endonuclease
MESVKGSYVLLIRVGSRKEIRVGKLGVLNFRPGFYAYVGSALNNLDKRIGRHLGSTKKMHWHIDYLLEKAEITEVFRIESPERLECGIAGKVSERLEPVPGFGCSDCGCGSHLFFSHGKEDARKSLIRAVSSLKR